MTIGKTIALTRWTFVDKAVKVKEEGEEAGLKLNIHKTKILGSGPINSWQIDGETMELLRDFIFLVSQITADGDCRHEIKISLK